MTTVTATISKHQNHIWAGKGKVISIDLTTGIVFLSMTTGAMKGHMGGFDISAARFQTVRTERQ